MWTVDTYQDLEGNTYCLVEDTWAPGYLSVNGARGAAIRFKDEANAQAVCDILNKERQG